jgi:hypothetical protein
VTKNDATSSDSPTYVCGVCHQTKRGSPSGGFNTVHGEVVTCSGKCWVEGMKIGQPVSAAEMLGREPEKSS